MIASIVAGFLLRLFFSASKVIEKLSKWKKEKILAGKKASIESRPQLIELCKQNKSKNT